MGAPRDNHLNNAGALYKCGKSGQNLNCNRVNVITGKSFNQLKSSPFQFNYKLTTVLSWKHSWTMARCICYQQKRNNHGKRSFKIIILFVNLKSISHCEFFDGLYFQVCSPRFGERVRGKCYYSRGNLPFESYAPWNEGKLLTLSLINYIFKVFDFIRYLSIGFLISIILGM